jgi:hypothetical protein
MISLFPLDRDTPQVIRYRRHQGSDTRVNPSIVNIRMLVRTLLPHRVTVDTLFRYCHQL